MWRIAGRALIVGAVAVSALLVVVAAAPQGRVVVRTVLFLPQVLSGIPVKPLQWVTRAPERVRIEFPLASGQGDADLYLPAGPGKHPAVVFFLGVVPPDRDEHRIVNLSQGLARSGIVVMVPWLKTQNENKIVLDDIDGLARAFQYLRTLDQVDPTRVGMGGICTGASMVTVAAQDGRIAGDVRFINFFAGYYDGVDLVKAIGSRSRFYGDDVSPWKPDSLTMRVMTEHLIDGVTEPSEKTFLTRLFVDKVADSGGGTVSLSPEAFSVYRLLKGSSPAEVDDLLAQLSPVTLRFLQDISPSTQMERLKARVLIMHDRADTLVPSEESRRLADALGKDGGAYHTEFSLFTGEIQVHVDESEGPGPLGYAREATKFFLHMYNLLRELS